MDMGRETESARVFKAWKPGDVTGLFLGVPLKDSSPSTTHAMATRAKRAKAAAAAAAVAAPVPVAPVAAEAPLLPEPTQAGPARAAPAGGDARPGGKSSVVYLGHLPHGFFEKQMRAFFKQFGKVKQLRLARSTRTGHTQHHAFLEFEFPEVAEIVAKTMNKYFMFDKYLVSHVVPADKVNPGMFAGAGKKFKAMPWRLIDRKRVNKAAHDPTKASQRKVKASKRAAERKAAITEAGIEYDVDAALALSRKRAKAE